MGYIIMFFLVLGVVVAAAAGFAALGAVFAILGAVVVGIVSSF